MHNIIFIDTETTSLANPHVIQLAARLCGGTCKSTFFKPPVAISLDAMVVHHITEADVVDKPAFTDRIEAIREYIGDKVVVMHNAEFDLRALANSGLILDNPVICTLKCSRALHPEIPRHALQYLRYYWNIKIEADAHDAVGDTAVLERIFYKLMDGYDNDQSEGAWEAAVARLINLSK
jgi:DNA polymerase III epsilon subunit-like protein